jgi:hypothetical protein
MILRRGRPYLIIGLAEPDAFLEYIGQNHDNRFSYNGDICTARQLAGRALYNFNQKRKGRARVDECMIGERMLLRRSDKKVNYDYPEKGDFFLSGIVSRIRQYRNSRYHHRRKR